MKVTTIRYYEGRGLLPDPGRTDGGQRRYGDAELDRLSFIAHARQLGFDLDAIAELIALQETPQVAHGDAHRIATDCLGGGSGQDRAAASGWRRNWRGSWPPAMVTLTGGPAKC